MVLKHESDFTIAKIGQPGFVQTERIVSVERNLARRRFKQRANDVQQRAFARTARPQNRQVLSAR